MKTTLDIQIHPVTFGTKVTTLGPQGPMGEKGDKGDIGDDVFYFSGVAGETLFGHRVVRINNGIVYLTNALDTLHMGQAFGVTQDAALLGEPVKVQFTGLLTEISWAYPPGNLWLSEAGLLSPNPPSTGFQQRIAKALTPTTILISIQLPTKLV